MEWYLGSEVDNLVIPRVQESLKRIKSLVSWTQYDATALGAVSCFAKKNLFVEKNWCCKQELYFNGIYTGEMNLNDSVQEKEHHNSVHDEDQARIDRMDDIFIKSLLEEDVVGDDNPSGNTFNDIILEQHFIPSNSHSLRSSKYLKTHDFSPPMDWENAELSSNFSAKSDSLSFFIEEEESSLEESVLHELEMITAQFTAKRRICFRDALYRLAENSKQPSHSQDGDIDMDNSPILTPDDESSRNGESEVEELRRNAINRAVAGLMFSRMNFGDGEDEEVLESNCGLSHHKISYCPLLARLSEVPVVPS